MSNDKNLEGLGGWLWLVGLGIVFSPLQILVTVMGYWDIFSDGTWEAVTTPGAVAYNANWAPYIIGEITINILLILAWLYIAVLFFGKHRWFPKWYIGMFAFSVVLIPLDAMIATSLIPGAQVFDAESGKQLARGFVGALIWIPYMLVSKRVKATFVN